MSIVTLRFTGNQFKSTLPPVRSFTHIKAIGFSVYDVTGVLFSSTSTLLLCTDSVISTSDVYFGSNRSDTILGIAEWGQDIFNFKESPIETEIAGGAVQSFNVLSLNIRNTRGQLVTLAPGSHVDVVLKTW